MLSSASEFRAFLIKENVLALAIGVVVGAALNDVVKAMVDGLIMPIVGAIAPAGSYAAWTWSLGGAVFRPGLIIAALVNFLVIGFVAWRLTRLFIKPEQPGPAASTRTCPRCYTTVDARASRCQHCTSDLAPTTTG